MTILVVEDDPTVLAFVDRMLTLNGHTVLAAEDADHARFVKPFTSDALLKAITGL
jgi:DNA-binding response OmpR family regulator